LTSVRSKPEGPKEPVNFNWLLNSNLKEKNMSDPTIQVLPKGPYLVAGKFTLLDASGNKIDAGGR
jgi:hypothetical protein